MAQRIYTPVQHAFFDNLVTFVASVSALGTAFEVQAGRLAQPHQPNQYITLEGLPAVAGCEFHIYAGPILTELLANRWPTMVKIDEAPISVVRPMHSNWLTGLQGVHGSIISNAFIQYFETNQFRVKAKYGQNSQGWPGIWDFGRVVRNAFAHSDRINIENISAAPVVWRNLIYTAASNGQQLLYKDLTAVEVILLMEEMDALL